MKFKRRRRSSASVSISAAFESQQDTSADIGGIVDGLRRWAKGCPIVAEIGVLGAGCDDKMIEPDGASFAQDFFVRDINGGNLCENDLDVVLTAQNTADRRGNVGVATMLRCDLIQQRLEQVIVC